MPQGATFLRTGVELARESSKDSGRALVFFEGGDVSLVRRAAYDWLFTNKDYSPNPYVTEPAFFSRAGIRAEGGIAEWWNALMEKIIYEPLDRRWKGWLGPWLEKYAAWGEKKEQEWADKRKQRTPVAESPPPAAEQAAFRGACNPFFDAMQDLGVKNEAELKQMVGISDEPASAPAK